MNSTQKFAWIFLFAVLIVVITFTYVGSILLFGRVPPRPLGQIVVGSVALGGLALFVLTVFSLTKRQSRVEPESDERDKEIMRNAVLVSFVATWLLLGLVVVILGLALGQTGAIPVYVLTIILLGVLVVTTLVCSATVLVQYGRTDKGE
jgi:uncharacterized membrane protein